jgi:hypothetical protein
MNANARECFVGCAMRATQRIRILNELFVLYKGVMASVARRFAVCALSKPAFRLTLMRCMSPSHH